MNKIIIGDLNNLDAKVDELTKGTDQINKLEFLGQNLKVEDLSIITKFIQTSSLVKQNKIVIIKQFNEINNNIQNRFLKIIEDTPENTIFILTTENVNAIIPTILSRVEKIYLPKEIREVGELSDNLDEFLEQTKNLSVEELTSYIVENVKMDQELLEMIKNLNIGSLDSRIIRTYLFLKLKRG